jgi:adenosylcobinamide kinase/adenosylcobinamide-phosphate guanylyltransferase
MFDEAGNERDVYDTVLAGILALEEKCDTLIGVTNEVWQRRWAYGASTARYIETIGRLNGALAARFDAVAELVFGIPLC